MNKKQINLVGRSGPKSSAQTPSVHGYLIYYNDTEEEGVIESSNNETTI